MRLLCRLGFHHRSRHRIQADEAGYVSICRHCRTPLRKQANGSWTVIPMEETGAPAGAISRAEGRHSS